MPVRNLSQELGPGHAQTLKRGAGSLFQRQCGQFDTGRHAVLRAVACGGPYFIHSEQRFGSIVPQGIIGTVDVEFSGLPSISLSV